MHTEYKYIHIIQKTKYIPRINDLPPFPERRKLSSRNKPMEKVKSNELIPKLAGVHQTINWGCSSYFGGKQTNL